MYEFAAPLASPDAGWRDKIVFTWEYRTFNDHTARRCIDVTILQRSPTYVMSLTAGID